LFNAYARDGSLGAVQTVSPESPEARRKRYAKTRARVGKSLERVKPGTRPFEVIKRVAIGVYSDGFIHAGNLAYLALLTIFPFVIVAAAVARLFGQSKAARRPWWRCCRRCRPMSPMCCASRSRTC
jgi:membrane protein